MDDGYKAYREVQRSAMNTRTLEREVFLKAAHLLDEAAKYPDELRVLCRAIFYVRKLWHILQADISREKNHLAPAQKARMLGLSLYMDKQSVVLLKKPNERGLAHLAELHRTLGSAMT